jgi:AraC-like DNA-binding protein
VELVISTEHLPPNDRLGFLREAAAQLPEPVDISSDGPAGFQSVSRFAPLATLTVGSLTTTGAVAWQVTRSRRMIRQSDPEAYRLLLNLQGETGMRQGGREASLGPGDMALYDTSRPLAGWRNVQDQPARLAMLLLPRQALPVHPSKVREIIGRPLPTRQGLGALVQNTVIALAEQTAPIAPVEAGVMARATVDLLAALVEQLIVGDPGPAPQARATVLARQVWAFIEENLGDPALSPGVIAGVHHVSLRTLHRLFAGEGRGVAAIIKARRLEQCRRDLANPAFVGRTVHSIAGRWGFTDAAHFTRSFRAEFGLTPTEFRHASASG